MMFDMRAKPRNRVFALAAMTVTVLAVALPASGQDRVYVMPDGTKYPLYRSDNEIGVVFRSLDVVEGARQRLETRGLGVVKDLLYAPRARVKVLRMAAGGDVTPADLKSDADIEDAHPVLRFSPTGSPVLPTGRMVVKVRPELSEAQRTALWKAYGAVVVRPFTGLHDVYILRPADPEVDEVLLAERLAGDDRTLWANPDLRRERRTLQVVPSDEYYDLQWHLNNTGSTGGAIDADIDAPEAWQIATGAGVLFGMFDDSCDVDHEDLINNYSGIGEDLALPFFDPDHSNPRPKLLDDAHGTAVMGLAVASANSVGVRGVAFQASFTASRGLGDPLSDSNVAAAYTFALAQGVDVHINSWGSIEGFPNPPVLVDAIQTAVSEGRDPDGTGPLPPRGMVVVFAAGNDNTQLIDGFDLSTIPGVISVGASTDLDARAGFSNFGSQLSFLAPGGSDVDFGITTVDTVDRTERDDLNRLITGYNFGGSAVRPGFPDLVFGPDIDSNGDYTGFFGGTSAACPIAAGVAGLMLSVNTNLTADEVRIIMEHSCDQISPTDAQYDGITSKSFKYGYGRINADLAVRAARDAVEGGGRVWPDAPKNVTVDGNTLSWTIGTGSEEFVVVQSSSDFRLIPQDGQCLDAAQECDSATLTGLPDGAEVIYVGCTGGCAAGDTETIDIVRPNFGSKLFGIYARNATGMYSFGATATAGAVQAPSVTITASPLGGNSPLQVQFNGNALSEQVIDHTRTRWDFDVNNLLGDNITVNATSTSASFTFTVPAGETRTYVSRLTMYDVLGTTGSSNVAVRVVGPELDSDVGPIEDLDIRIVAAVPGTPGTTTTGGSSPFSVELRIEATATGSIDSVVWNLGDGSSAASGLSVLHTYRHSDTTARTYVPTATVTATTSGGVTASETLSKIITVSAGQSGTTTEDPNLPGTEVPGEGGRATICGLIGMLPLMIMLATLYLARRRRQ